MTEPISTRLLRAQADATAQQFTQEQLRPAAEKVADGAEQAAGQFRSRGEDAANYVDEQGELQDLTRLS